MNFAWYNLRECRKLCCQASNLHSWSCTRQNVKHNLEFVVACVGSSRKVTTTLEKEIDHYLMLLAKCAIDVKDHWKLGCRLDPQKKTKKNQTSCSWIRNPSSYSIWEKAVKPHKHWNGGALWGSRTERGRKLIWFRKTTSSKVLFVSVNDRWSFLPVDEYHCHHHYRNHQSFLGNIGRFCGSWAVHGLSQGYDKNCDCSPVTIILTDHTRQGWLLSSEHVHSHVTILEMYDW